MDFFSFLSGQYVCPNLGLIVSIIRKRRRNTNLVKSICFNMKKTWLLVDVCPSKTPWPIVDMPYCNTWMEEEKSFTNRFTRVIKDKLPKLHVFLHCCSALKVFPLKHNSYVCAHGNFTSVNEILTGARISPRQWKSILSQLCFCPTFRKEKW